MFKLSRRCALIGAVAGSCFSLVSAQSSRKPLRLIVSADVGSGTDAVARSIQNALSTALNGQPVFIENIAAAGGLVATQQLVNAPADGNTALFISDNHTVNPHVFAKMPFNTLEDVSGVAILVTVPEVLAVTPNLPVRTAQELIAHIKAKPKNTFNYASSGVGTVIHLAGQMFADVAKMDVVHVPYKGVSPQLQAVANGEAAYGVFALPAIQGFLQAGTLRAVALMGGPQIPGLPDPLPMQGMPEIDWSAWVGITMRSGTQPDEVKRLHKALETAFTDPKALETVKRLGMRVQMTSTEQANRHIRSEYARYAKLVKAAGITPS